MDLIEVEKLLVKYENAETTLREEAILRTYFLSKKVPAHLKEYEHIFSYFKASKNETSTVKKGFMTITKNYSWMSIAASVLLLLGIYVGNIKFREYQEKNEALNTLAAVTKGLKLVSTNLNKGNKSFKKLFVYEDTLNKVLNINRNE